MVKRISSLITFNWIVLILIYLVVVAGSFVRITGSGMGCPDWPKCFGQWVPPTDEAVLPVDYKEKYVEGRTKKIEKFARFLRGVGLESTASQIENDPNLKLEQPFNASKTWTEYVNRLVGFLAGNGMLIAFLWLLLKFRRRKLIFLSMLNLVLMAIQAWFGSIVVASNLVPWTITVHMFLALVIIALQLLLIHWLNKERSRAAEEEVRMYALPSLVNWLLVIAAGITTYQMFLGTQVREMIDELTIMGYTRQDWTDQLGLPFYIHRSFSWLVLILVAYLAYRNEKNEQLRSVRWVTIVLVLELISGVLLAYADMPGLVQTSHLIFASVLFGMFVLLLLRLRRDWKIR